MSKLAYLGRQHLAMINMNNNGILWTVYIPWPEVDSERGVEERNCTLYIQTKLGQKII
jgi:hypothetical protein